MRHFGAIAALALLATPVMAQTAPPPAISVSGEANMSVAPDEAQINGGVTSEAKTAREASDANNAAMGKVLLALKGAGIEEKDYQTSRLSLQPQYPPNPVRTGPATISGYRASNRVTIREHDVTKVAGVIDVLVGAGARDRRHPFRGDAGLKAARRYQGEGGRGCSPQGRNLCQGCWRDAGRTAEYFRGRCISALSRTGSRFRHACRRATAYGRTW
jgi:hypothetical protein